MLPIKNKIYKSHELTQSALDQIRDNHKKLHELNQHTLDQINNIKNIEESTLVPVAKSTTQTNAEMSVVDVIAVKNPLDKTSTEATTKGDDTSPSPHKLLIKTDQAVKEKVVMVKSEKTKIRTEVLLLMDSNRKFIKPKNLLGNGKATIIKTSTAAEIMGIINVLDLSHTNNVVLSTGTNDTDNTEVDDIVHLIINAADQINKQAESGPARQ